jgi:hypothetical protein
MKRTCGTKGCKREPGRYSPFCVECSQAIIDRAMRISRYKAV